jgi:capsule polysaccharide modification protein KpsS
VLHKFAARNVLLLQGPMGPFFHRLARDLRSVGARVSKINFNAGDRLFFPSPHAVSYRGDADSWPGYLDAFIREHSVDAIFLFGDCRPLHVAAKRVALDLDVPVFVFEEGYLRPNYITFERGGVNRSSSIPKEAEYFRQNAPKVVPDAPAVNAFWPLAFYSALYALACTLFAWCFPRYRHHKNINAFRHAFYWVRGGLRKLWYRRAERRLLGILCTERSKRFFLAPLQVHNDSQVVGSRFKTVTEFIRVVMDSFAKHAREEDWLVFKHHPMDRGETNYAAIIREIAARHGISQRVHYVHDLHLPTLLKLSRGVVVINSTTGLSALYHRAPTIALDRAIYDFLCHRGELADFWRRPQPVARDDLGAFQRWLRAHVLMGGSFYWRPKGGRFQSARWDAGHRLVELLERRAAGREAAGDHGAPEHANPANSPHLLQEDAGVAALTKRREVLRA